MTHTAPNSLAAHGVREMSGTGPRSGPAGAAAPARRKARKPSERSERPALEGKQKNFARRLRLCGARG